MKKYLILITGFLFFSFLFVGAFYILFGGGKEYEISSAEKAVNQALARNIKALTSKYNMRPVGITVGMPSGDIRYLEIKFQIQGPLSREELRKILVNSTQDFLSDLNADEELCSFLKNPYFTINDIGVTLFIVDSSGRGVKNPNIRISGISKGELKYNVFISVYNPEIKRDIPELTDQFKESYEEAVERMGA